MTIPRGMPTTMLTHAATVDCEAMAPESCRCVNPSDRSRARSRRRRRTEAVSVKPRATTAPSGSPPRYDRRGPDAAVVDDLGRALHAQDADDVVARGVGSAAMALLPTWAMCRRPASPAAALTPGRRRTKTYCGPLRFGSELVEGVDPGGGFNLRGEQGTRPHGGVVGHDARIADGGEGGRPDDPERRRRYIDRRVLGCPDADIDGGADVRVQQGQRGRAQDDLPFVVDTVSRQDRWGDRRAGVDEQRGDVLATDQDRHDVGPVPRRHVGIVVEQLDGLWWDIVGGVDHVVPVPPVESRVGDERAQAAGERERGDHHGHGQYRAC